MCLNIGGAVLGVALTTVVMDSVSSESGSSANQTSLDGYRAGYYLCLGFSCLATALSLIMIFFPARQEEPVASDRSATDLHAMEDASIESNQPVVDSDSPGEIRGKQGDHRDTTKSVNEP